MKGARCTDVNLCSQQLLKILDQRYMIKEASSWLPLHKKVKIAGLRGLASRYGTKNTDAPGAVLFSETEYLAALLRAQRVQGDHATHP